MNAIKRPKLISCCATRHLGIRKKKRSLLSSTHGCSAALSMSPIQFVGHVLTRLRRAEAIRKQAEQSDTFEQVTDELTLLIPDDVVDANASYWC